MEPELRILQSNQQNSDYLFWYSFYKGFSKIIQTAENYYCTSLLHKPATSCPFMSQEYAVVEKDYKEWKLEI